MKLAGRQYNRVSRSQLLALGFTARTVDHRIAIGRLVAVEEGVYAVAPVLAHDTWGRWMGATLTAPETFLSHVHAGYAYEVLGLRDGPITVTRPGSGGPRRIGGLLVHRSSMLEGETTSLHGIPITSIPRTLVDLAGCVSQRALARAVREAIRLEHATLHELGDALGSYRGRRGSCRLALTLARYAGLPLEHARSGAEIRALEIIRDAGRHMPRLNRKVAGEEADLSWPRLRLIVEIDGGPFHLDVGEDARKQATWEAAGWEVRRLPADAVYETPQRLLALSPP